MNKRLLSFVLCLLFIIPFISSCGKQDLQDSEADIETIRYPMTLSLWVPTDPSTSEESIKMVEDALSALTEAKYKTRIELHAIPEDQYKTEVDAKIKAIDDEKKAAESLAESERQQAIDDAIAGIVHDDAIEKINETEESEAVVTEETYLDEFGQKISVYPGVDSDQMDIFLIKGYDNYRDYIDNGLIQSLDGELTYNAKKLYSYIYPSYLQIAKVDEVYAIPNNRPIADYQLLLVNKRLVKEYDYSPSELTTLLDCQDFIIDIGNQDLDVTPLLGYVETPNMVYFSIDDQFSIICSQIKAGTEYTSNTPPMLITSTDYTKTLGMMKTLDSLGYIGDGKIDDGEEFAVGVVTGDATLFDKYSDDYYVNIYANPLFNTETALHSAFAVCSYTKDVSRSMEVITYLNTDPTFRTILQWGVEGIHWEKYQNADDETVIRLLRDDYKMNINDTGNVFLTYPDVGVPMSYWEYGKQQNIDSVCDPFIGFDQSEYITESNKEQMQTVARRSAMFLTQITEASADEYSSLISQCNREFMSGKIIGGLVSEESTETVDDTIVLLYNLYYKTK